MIQITAHSELNKEPKGTFNSVENAVVNCCGYNRTTDRDITTIREKGRRDYFIVYIIEGYAEYVFNNVKTTAKKGSLIFVEPGRKQHYSYFSKAKTEVYWCHFSGKGIKKLFNENNIEPEKPVFVGIDPKCIELFKKIINELMIKKYKYDKMASVYFEQLVYTYARLLKKGKSKNNKKLSNTIYEYINSRYYEDITLDMLANQSGYSKYRFAHLFKEETGISPIKYLNKIRIERAKEVLSDTNLKIYEIAEMTGFQNPFYFSRMFKDHTGKSPEDFRKITCFPIDDLDV